MGYHRYLHVLTHSSPTRRSSDLSETCGFDQSRSRCSAGTAWPQLHIFGEDEQALLQTVGVLAARALARGRRYDAEHRAAVAFQQAALPDEQIGRAHV